MTAKQRIDLLLVERGLVSSREKAQRLVMTGNVLVDDVPITKSGQKVSTEANLRIRGEESPYVARSALKLLKGLDSFQLADQVKGKVGLDIGASTGGFTEVLLEKGAERVYSVDVGQNQLDWKIRNHEKVVSLEKTNARYLTFDQIGQKVDFIVMDVSFISITKILPALVAFAEPETHWVVLIKPQFEVGKDRVGKGGVVRSDDDHREVVEKIKAFGETLGLACRGLIESPIKGTHGNKEFLIHWQHEFSPSS